MSTHKLQPTRPPTNSGETPNVITPAINSYTPTGLWQHPHDTTPGAPSYTLHDADLRPLPNELSDNSHSSPRHSPGRALKLHSQQFTQSAQPPPRPRPSRSTWLRGGGESACARGACTPQPPTPRQTRHPSFPSDPKCGGAGALEERKLTCLSRGRKKFGSHPLPPPLGAG